YRYLVHHRSVRRGRAGGRWVLGHQDDEKSLLEGRLIGPRLVLRCLHHGGVFLIAPEVRFLMRRRIAALFFALIYFQTNVCQAFVPVTPVGAEIAQVLASRGAVTGLSRVFAGLGPWGILASVLIPVVYGWVTQPDGSIKIPGKV